MRSAWFRRLGFATLASWLALGAAGSSGCAQTREEVNRVQANYIKKADLLGDYTKPESAPEWYMRNLVLEVARTNPWLSDGLQDLTRRIRFEAQENYLIARLAYEYLDKSDGKGGPAGKTNNGAIVAMWPISSHFDIRKEYNTSTGEENNVTSENMSDRRWYEREYMRVDWARNLINDPYTLWFTDVFGGDMEVNPVPWFESDPSKKHVSNFGEMGTGYFDVTSRWLLKPLSFDYYGSKVPYCLLYNMRANPDTYAEGTKPCDEQEIVLRSSFMKVPVGEASTDYEVQENNSLIGDIAGIFWVDRHGYDRQYGPTDATWHQYTTRYNLWKKSHNDVACGIPDMPGVVGAAATICSDFTKDADGKPLYPKADQNSHCDLNVKRCTIPYMERTIAPVVWYADQDLPERLLPSTKKSIGHWNETFKRAVSYGREAECRRIVPLPGEPKPGRDECHAKYFKGPIDPTREDEGSSEDVFVFCNNPVRTGDPQSCGPVGTKIRKGDIRHHMVAWWNNPSDQKPLGVVVLGGDPLTGEQIGTMVNIFGASVEDYSARARDQIQLISGDFTPTEYAAGLPSDLYSGPGGLFPNQPKMDPVLDSFATHVDPSKRSSMGMSKEEMTARVKAIDVTGTAARLGITKAMAGVGDSAIEKIAAYNAFTKKQGALGTPGFGGVGEYQNKLQLRMDALKRAGAESTIMNDKWTSAVGLRAGSESNTKALDEFSPLRGGSPLAMKSKKNAHDTHLHDRGMCMLDQPQEFSLRWMSGASAKYKARYKDKTIADGRLAELAGVKGQPIDRIARGKLIYQELVEPTYEFTLLHEMGHLVSLNHDFTASWDAPNFEPNYWTLRAQGDSTKMAACDPENPRKDGSPDTCMGPRWLDPLTTDELGTTVGKEHDSLDAYAVSSVMDYKFDTIYNAQLGNFDKMATKLIYANLLEIFDDEKFSLVKNGTGKKYVLANALMNSDIWIVSGALAHYTDMGRALNLFDKRRCRPATAEEITSGDAQMGMHCTAPHKDHAFIWDTESATPFTDFTVGSVKEKGTAGRYRWPYKVSNGNPNAYVHNYYYDNGADFYELTLDAVERYELQYLDMFYRKGDREWTQGNAGRWMSARFFDRIQSLQWNAISDVARDTKGAPIDPASFADNDAKAKLLSLTLLFDTMQKALLRPQPGAYTLNKTAGMKYDLYTTPDGVAPATKAFSLGIGDARFIDAAYDTTKKFDYQSYAIRDGSYLEKPYASIALTDARPQLSTVARETYLDGRNVMFSFRSAIPKAFDRLVAGVFADDWDTVAPYIDPSDKPDPFGMSPVRGMRLWEEDSTKIIRPAGSKLIDPMLGQRIKVPAMYLMLLYQPIDSSMELINRTRIWIEGGPEAVKVPDAEKLSFFDPQDGIQWTSRTFGKETLAGKRVDVGIGARMLEHANDLVAAAYDVEMEDYPDAPGQKRVKYVDNRPVPTGGVGPLKVKNAAALAKLRLFVGFLNTHRQLLFWLGYGPCGRTEVC